MNRDYAKVIGPKGETTITLNALPVAMGYLALYQMLDARRQAGEFFTILEVGREENGVQTPYVSPEAQKEKDIMEHLGKAAGVPLGLNRM